MIDVQTEVISRDSTTSLLDCMEAFTQQHGIDLVVMGSLVVTSKCVNVFRNGICDVVSPTDLEFVRVFFLKPFLLWLCCLLNCLSAHFLLQLNCPELCHAGGS